MRNVYKCVPGCSVCTVYQVRTNYNHEPTLICDMSLNSEVQRSLRFGIVQSACVLSKSFRRVHWISLVDVEEERPPHTSTDVCGCALSVMLLTLAVVLPTPS